MPRGREPPGAILHQNESHGATLIATVKAVCSHAVSEAKTNYWAAVVEAKTTKYHLIQAAEVTCSKAISDTKAQTTSQATMFQEEHCNYLWDLEEQALREESRSHQDLLSSCEAALCHSPQLIRGCWLHHTIYYWGKHLHCLHSSSPQGPLLWKNRHPQLLLPCWCPNSLWDWKGNILCKSQWGTCSWVEPPRWLQWGDLLTPRNKKPLPGSNH